jgi:NADH-quinone oxidoreductase subunit J
MVLFLFVIMLMNLNAEMNLQNNKLIRFAGFLAGLCLFLVLVAALKDAGTKKQMVQTAAGDIGLIKNLGIVLFREYVVPFEISSVLFLSAMVGAVVIGKKE